MAPARKSTKTAPSAKKSSPAKAPAKAASKSAKSPARTPAKKSARAPAKKSARAPAKKSSAKVPARRPASRTRAKSVAKSPTRPKAPTRAKAPVAKKSVRAKQAAVTTTTPRPKSPSPASKTPTKTATKTPSKTATKATSRTASKSTLTAATKTAAPAPSMPTRSVNSDLGLHLDVPPPRGVTKDGVAYTKDFDVKFLKAQRDQLVAERLALVGQADRLEDEANSLIEDGEMGDVQFDDESGEGDTMVVERERDLALSAQARETVAHIDAALARIANGRYGYSLLSGRPIPRERLEAIPWATELVEEKVGGIGRR